MTAPIDIPANERGVIRVFALSMTDAEAQALKDSAETVSEALGTGLLLDMAHVEVFPLTDLEGVGLVDYLAEGGAVPADQLAPDRAKLEKLGGWVIVLYSLAFGDQPAALHPAAALTLIGTYGETRIDYRATETVTSDAAKPYTAPQNMVKKQPSNAAMSGRIALIVLLVLALFTYIFIRIAG